jgi:hypothetical protein
MPKRELNIPVDKQLNTNTKEDLLLNSPPPIPDRGLRDMVQMGRINGSACSYYDIAPTEIQSIHEDDNIVITIFSDTEGVNLDIYQANIGGPQEVGGRPMPFDEQDLLDKFNIILGDYSE